MSKKYRHTSDPNFCSKRSAPMSCADRAVADLPWGIRVLDRVQLSGPLDQPVLRGCRPMTFKRPASWIPALLIITSSRSPAAVANSPIRQAISSESVTSPGDRRTAELVDLVGQTFLEVDLVDVSGDGGAVRANVSAAARPIPAAAPVMNTALLVPMTS
jgi:hypothetical protein